MHLFNNSVSNIDLLFNLNSSGSRTSHDAEQKTNSPLRPGHRLKLHGVVQVLAMSSSARRQSWNQSYWILGQWVVFKHQKKHPRNSSSVGAQHINLFDYLYPSNVYTDIILTQFSIDNQKPFTYTTSSYHPFGDASDESLSQR